MKTCSKFWTNAGIFSVLKTGCKYSFSPEKAYRCDSQNSQIFSQLHHICELSKPAQRLSFFPHRKPPLATCHPIAFTYSEYRPCVGTTCVVTSARRCSFKVSLHILSVPLVCLRLPVPERLGRNLVHVGYKPYLVNSGHHDLSLEMPEEERENEDIFVVF